MNKFILTLTLYVLQRTIFFGQITPLKDIVSIDYHKIYSSLDQADGETLKVLNHQTDYVQIEGKVLRSATNYNDLLPYAYGIIDIDLEASPIPTVQIRSSTQNFTALYNIDSSRIEIHFEVSVDANFMTLLTTPLNAEHITQAIAHPLTALAENHKIVLIASQPNGLAPIGQYSISFVAYY